MARTNKRASTSRTSAVFLLAMTLFGGALGLPFFGKIGILVGALGGICVGIVVDASLRASRNPLLKDGSPMDLAGLDAQQKLAMLGQGLTAGAGDFRSVVLKGVDQAAALADEDLEAGWRSAKQLTQEHPRSPAAWELVGRLAQRGGRGEEATQASSRAFELAAQGGLNQLLIDYFDALEPDIRERLELSRSAWSQVAAALRARNREDEALLALRQAEQVDAELDAERRSNALQVAARALRAAGENEAADISDLLAAGRSQG